MRNLAFFEYDCLNMMIAIYILALMWDYRNSFDNYLHNHSKDLGQ